MKTVSGVPRTWEALNDWVVFSPSPRAPMSICGGSWVKEHESEGHTDLVPLLSDYVTSGKVFNFLRLSFPPL